ncbi:unnamed protein product (macronuclear) [Paramecium tetraurelia]|uniref:Uncharacterized protein n=1 Tax=Paramecium tetraurelia TaxID=5888 RepID=A0BT27_PARTE|nr:uncharacterized protein GSPATT00031926001 [Paramecium tetraurelia]CAK61694.1 unnamed protein product [Paramecium tetraurelia]|eukprot:XP_001429092.1 hypothetical protein (macronuclear) [Paramecium tetraurelia strain d4-2]
MRVVLLKSSITTLPKKDCKQKGIYSNQNNHNVIRYLQVSYFLIAKTLESMKLQESIALKSQAINDQTKKKSDNNNRMTFKLEFDKKANLQTQRKSQDALTIEKKPSNFAIIQNMFDLETKNLEIYMQAQEKKTQIQQLQSQLEQQNIKQEQQVRHQNQEKDELLQKIQQLEHQCEEQKRYIDQIPLMQAEAQEWKDRFLNLNKLFHQSQEVIFRIEAEQQSSQRRTFNFKV